MGCGDKGTRRRTTFSIQQSTTTTAAPDAITATGAIVILPTHATVSGPTSAPAVSHSSRLIPTVTHSTSGPSTIGASTISSANSESSIPGPAVVTVPSEDPVVVKTPLGGRRGIIHEDDPSRGRNRPVKTPFEGRKGIIHQDDPSRNGRNLPVDGFWRRLHGWFGGADDGRERRHVGPGRRF